MISWCFCHIQGNLIWSSLLQRELQNRLWHSTLAITSRVTQLTRWSMLASVLLSAMSESLVISFSALSLKVPIRPLKYLQITVVLDSGLAWSGHTCKAPEKFCNWTMLSPPPQKKEQKIPPNLKIMTANTGHTIKVEQILQSVSLWWLNNSQAAERRVHDPALFIPQFVVLCCYQTITEEP